MNSRLHLASHGVSKSGEDEKFWSGAGMSWDSVIATASRERKAVFVRLDTVFLAPLPCWAVPPAHLATCPFSIGLYLWEDLTRSES